MTTEREKMLADALYDPLDRELVAARGRARDTTLRDVAHRPASRRFTTQRGRKAGFVFPAISGDVRPTVPTGR
jgi:hypothetical protein